MYFRLVAGVTSASELDELVEQLKRGLATPVQTSPESEFGEKLKEAVRRRVQNRRGYGFKAGASQDQESFGSKLADAAKRRAAGMRLTSRRTF
jgi:hypothetical protein